jgi:hypothetical protein
MGCEAGALAALLLRRDGHRSPWRWLLALGAFLLLFLCFAAPAMHANNAVFLHELWLALMGLLCVVGLLGSIVARILRRRRKTAGTA